MKKVLVVLLFPFVAMAQNADGFMVRGKLTGLKDSTDVFLVNGNDGQTVFTTKAMNGAFTLKGKLADPGIFQLNIAGLKDPVDLFMYNDAVAVTGDLADARSINVKGSSLQDDFMVFKAEFVPLLDKLRGLAAVINPEKDPLRRDSLLQQYNIYKYKALEATLRFVKTKNASPVAPFVLTVMTPVFNSFSEVETNYAALLPAAKKGVFARMIEKNIADARIGSIGSQAMDFTQKDVNDKPVTLSSFRGKYVLIDFWASWCRPCRAENPNVVNAYNKYKDKNFTVLGVSLDQAKPNWIQAIQADKLTWTHVSDLKFWENAVAQLYRIQSIPANMLIDPTGKIIAKDLRGEDLNRALKDLLK
ncbi:MAG: Peroxiredoxin [Sediminibacterium sp.]|nr:Peroxiredoxin [Sediminibacterium sp.]